MVYRIPKRRSLSALGGTVALAAFAPLSRASLVSTTGGTVSLSGIHPLLVTPGDTFSFDISGFNSAGTVGYLLTPDETVAFGATTTFAAAGVNGQDISITSSEAIGASMTTDTFTVSTPTNFLTTAKVNTTTIASLEFDLGNANSGSNTVDYLTPVTNNTQTGNILYGTANTSFTLSPSTILTNGGLSLAAVEGVNTGTTAISGIAVHSFTYSVTFTTIPVPEPATAGSMLVGGAGLLVRRRRRLQPATA